MALEAWEIIGIPLFGGAAGYAVWCAVEGMRAQDWPSVPGEITSSKIDSRFGRGGPHYTPTVTYIYSVEGVRYQAERLQFGDPDYSFKSRAERRIRPYAVGSQVVVRYHPNHPGRAVLEPGVGFDIYGMAVMSGAFWSPRLVPRSGIGIEMPVTRKRVPDLLVMVLIGLVIWAAVITYALLGPFARMPSARWLELAVWTGVLFWIVARIYRSYWRRLSFWLKVATCVAAHLCAWTVVLRSVPEWNQFWFIPPILVEGVIIMMVLDRLGVHPSGAE